MIMATWLSMLCLVFQSNHDTFFAQIHLNSDSHHFKEQQYTVNAKIL